MYNFWEGMPEDIAKEVDKQAYIFLSAEGYNIEKCETNKKERKRLYKEVTESGAVLRTCHCYNPVKDMTTLWVELTKANGEVSRSRGVNIKNKGNQ